MITEDYVTHEVAKLLKEKGFPQNIITKELVLIRDCSFNVNGSLVHHSAGYTLPYEHYYYRIHKDNWANIPTLQRACKWLRLKHHLYVHVVIYCDQESSPYWNWFINNTETGQTVGENTSLIQCDSPEEAYNDGVKYCLEKLI